jgi:hypothetical protein
MQPNKVVEAVAPFDVENDVTDAPLQPSGKEHPKLVNFV